MLSRAVIYLNGFVCKVYNISNKMYQDTTQSEDSLQEAMRAVSTLNAAFSAFDDEVQGPMVYKVETVGHVYMAVSGAPDKNPLHAEHAADLALNMVRRMKELNLANVSVQIGENSLYAKCIGRNHFQTTFYLRNSFWISCSWSCWSEGSAILFVW